MRSGQDDLSRYSLSAELGPATQESLKKARWITMASHCRLHLDGKILAEELFWAPSKFEQCLGPRDRAASVGCASDCAKVYAYCRSSPYLLGYRLWETAGRCGWSR